MDRIKFRVIRIKQSLRKAVLGLRKFNRNIRNIFTNEQEKELKSLSVDYFRLRGTLEQLKQDVTKILDE